MKVVIKSISQDVDLLNPKITKNFLVLEEEDSHHDFRVPISEETVQALLKELHSKHMTPSIVEEPESPSDEDLEGATEFSAESDELETEYQDLTSPPEDGELESEEQVKSL
jgi:hypothetical protein